MAQYVCSALGEEFDALEGFMPVPTSEKGLEHRKIVLGKLDMGVFRLESIPCFCEGEKDDLVLANVDRYRIPHRSVLCSRCGLVRTDPRMDAASYTEFYAQHYRAIYERPGQTVEKLFVYQQPNAESRRMFIEPRLKSGWPASVLEIGCGGGWNLLPLSARGCSTVGYDFDQEYLAHGRGRGLDLRTGGIDAALACGKRYDLLILSHVVEHLLDPVGELRRVGALLEPHGMLFVEVPSVLRCGHPLLRYFQNAHTYSFTTETLSLLMEMAGYVEVAADSQVRSLWSFADRTGARWTSSPARAKEVLHHLRRVAHPSRLNLVLTSAKIAVARLLR